MINLIKRRAEPPGEPPIEWDRTVSLTVSLEYANGRGETKGFAIKSRGMKSIPDEVRRFYKWYFCRRQSGEYAFRFENGSEVMIKRDHIVGYDLKIEPICQ